MEVNFFGSINCTRAALESLIERKGMIIVITSIAGIAPLYGRTGYSASKHALHGFFESLRTELKEIGVHVMMVSPGFTQTNLQTRALDGTGKINLRPRSIPGTQMTPKSVAEAVYKGACRKKRSIVLTIMGKISFLIIKFFSAFYERLMVRAVKKEFE
jgi:short-subunit dehydrogenase